MGELLEPNFRASDEGRGAPKQKENGRNENKGGARKCFRGGPRNGTYNDLTNTMEKKLLLKDMYNTRARIQSKKLNNIRD